jgi:sulfofructosephosphate aldolase
MSGNHTDVTGDLVAPLRTPEGGFAMLALDQRESLRRMFPLVDGVEVDDDALRRFKTTATRTLTPHASAVLLDRLYAIGDARPATISPGCRLILAADALHQPPGEPVVATSLDPEVTPEFVRRVGADAIKLLLLWRRDDRAAERAALVADFLAVARAAGVASLVEAIARPADGEIWESHDARHAAILDAAREIAPLGGDIYKAEVPGYVPGDVSSVRAHAERMSAIVPVPWVVLSNGVQPADFAEALREARLGGAHGFLAGRAIWADTVADPDTDTALATRATERLRTLGEIVSNGA